MMEPSPAQASDLSELIDLLTSPVAVADSAGVIRCTSAAWRKLAIALQPGASLYEQSEALSRVAAKILSGQLPSAEVEIGGALRCVLRPCRVGGARGALIEAHAHEPGGESSAHMRDIAGALREREMQVATIAANLPGILYRVVLHPDGTVTFPYISPDPSATVARASGEHWLDRIHPDDRAEFFAVLRGAAEQLLPFDLEQRVIGVAGQELWVRNITRPHRQPDGAVIWDGMVLDITAQKRIEQDLQRSLQEKVALLQEVHHRVKNNLQIMSSLLDLQALTTRDPTAQRAFAESQRRIRAMALVHEQLYHIETMAQIDFGAYARTLTDYLKQSFMPLSAQVEVRIEIEEIWLDANAAIPCGLIINELVSNAFKHAFSPHSPGGILVSCAKSGPGQLTLTVADNGSGLPTSDVRRPDALGLKLVSTLVRQLHGQLQIENQGGARISVTFSAAHASRNV